MQDTDIITEQTADKLKASMVLRLISLRTGDVLDSSPPAGQAPLTLRATTQASEFPPPLSLDTLRDALLGTTYKLTLT